MENSVILESNKINYIEVDLLFELLNFYVDTTDIFDEKICFLKLTGLVSFKDEIYQHTFEIHDNDNSTLFEKLEKIIDENVILMPGDHYLIKSYITGLGDVFQNDQFNLQLSMKKIKFLKKGFFSLLYQSEDKLQFEKNGKKFSPLSFLDEW